MVLDHNFSVTYATGDLATMLGYTVKYMVNLSLEDLLPIPFGPLHKKWLKVLSRIFAQNACHLALHPDG